MKTNFIAGLFLFLMGLTFNSQSAYARGGGGGMAGDMGFSVLMSTTGTEQNRLNSVAAANGSSDLPSATEFIGEFEYRFSRTMFSALFRPSYFTQKASKSCTGGNCEFNLTGYTIFPVFRLYPLENNFIKFFMQAGLGYGSLSGELSNPSASVSFNGGAIGYVGGIGVQFCFTDSHCMVVEGNMRYLPIERNIASSSSGSFSGISQSTAHMEVEDVNGHDLQTSMGGIQGIIGYHMNF